MEEEPLNLQQGAGPPQQRVFRNSQQVPILTPTRPSLNPPFTCSPSPSRSTRRRHLTATRRPTASGTSPATASRTSTASTSTPASEPDTGPAPGAGGAQCATGGTTPQSAVRETEGSTKTRVKERTAQTCYVMS